MSDILNEEMIGLKVTGPDPAGKYTDILARYGAEVSAMEDSPVTEEYVLSCTSADTAGLRRIRRCHNELKKAGAKVQLYASDEPVAYEYVSQMIGSRRVADKQRHLVIDAELENEKPKMHRE